MYYLISYDIASNKLRHKIAKYLESFALRLQYSLFYCEISVIQAQKVQRTLANLVGTNQNCTVLIAPLCSSCQQKMYLLGKALEEKPICVIV